MRRSGSEVLLEALVDEAITASPFLRAFHRGNDSMSYLWSGAGALVWGVPAALGAKLASPERPVVCIVGDGRDRLLRPLPGLRLPRLDPSGSSAGHTSS